MPKHKSCVRDNEPGDAHFLTFSCFRQQAFLSRDRSRRWFLDALISAAEREQFGVWAWVIMPEHVHLLILPTEPDYSVSRILSSIKVPVTRRATFYLKTHDPDSLSVMKDKQPGGQYTHRFWQRGGGHDRNVSEPAAVWEIIDYIHANPVWRGYCERAEDWQWSSAADYSGKRDDVLVPISRESLPRTKDG